MNITGPSAASAIAIMRSPRRMTRCWRLDPASYAAIAIANTPRTTPDCIKTADYFHDTITQLDQARTRFIAVSEKFAARGLDVEPINNQLTELGDALKKSRTYVHSFSRNTFQQVAAPGEEAVKRTDALVNKATRRIQIPSDRSRCEHRALSGF